MTGLQVVDSHGMIVGRIRKVVPTESGAIRSLVIAVDKEPLRTSLNNPGISDEVEVSNDKIIAIGEVAILSDMFSFSLLKERPSRVGPQNRRCPGCGAVILEEAKFCIACGRESRATEVYRRSSYKTVRQADSRRYTLRRALKPAKQAKWTHSVDW